MIIIRYVLRQFFQILIFALLALILIFIIVNMIENLDDFIDNNATREIIFRYYVYFTPEVIKLVTPISVLVAILFSVGRMSSLNEIMAMKSGGLSLYQLIIPFFIINLALSFALLYFNGWVVPRSNEKKFIIEKKYLKKEVGTATIYNFFFRDNPTRNVSFQYYDPEELRGQYIFVEEFISPEKPRITKRIEAKSFRWDAKNNRWVFYDVLVRDFLRPVPEINVADSVFFQLRIKHNELLKLQKKVEEMNFTELREYLDLLSKGGRDVRRQMIRYYSGYAFPFSCTILVLFAVPFASIKRRGGIALQIAGAMTFSFLYLFFTEIGQILVYTTSLHPAFGGWIANFVFALFGIFVLIYVRK